MTSGVRDGKPKKESLFEGLSASQIIAGALAAITSMLLASQIGIAGSVIGVGFGSVVSAVASQLYKKFLASSAEKIHGLGSPDLTSKAASQEANQIETGKKLSGEERNKAVTADVTAQLKASQVELKVESQTGKTAEQTSVLQPVVCRRSNTPKINDEALKEDATVIRAKELRRNKRKLQQGVTLVAIVSALVTVVVSAFLINTLTNGEGVGIKAPSLSEIKTQDWQSGAGTEADLYTDSPSADSGSDQGGVSASPDDAKQGESSDSSNNGSSGSTGGETGGGTTTTPDENGDSDSGKEPNGGDAGNSGAEGSGSGSNQGSSSGSGSGSGSSSSSGSSSGSDSD